MDMMPASMPMDTQDAPTAPTQEALDTGHSDALGVLQAMPLSPPSTGRRHYTSGSGSGGGGGDDGEHGSEQGGSGEGGYSGEEGDVGHADHARAAGTARTADESADTAQLLNRLCFCGQMDNNVNNNGDFDGAFDGGSGPLVDQRCYQMNLNICPPRTVGLVSSIGAAIART